MRTSCTRVCLDMSTRLTSGRCSTPKLSPAQASKRSRRGADSLHLKSESGQSADVKLAIKLAAKHMNRQPKAVAPKPLRMSIDRGASGITRRGSMHKCA